MVGPGVAFPTRAEVARTRVPRVAYCGAIVQVGAGNREREVHVPGCGRTGGLLSWCPVESDVL
ncbi:hypothetical protein GCM10028793_19470 [Nocardiopsis oceani]